MDIEIIKFDLDNELDVKLAFKRATKIGELAGLNISDRTKFANAVTKISRNSIEYAGNGTIKIYVRDGSEEKPLLMAEISDKGKGIRDLDSVLNRKQPFRTGRGMGIVNARNSVEEFHITTGGEGTTVLLGKKISYKHFSLERLKNEWREYLDKETSTSPYEEVKNKNIMLSQLTEQLRLKNLEAENQIEEIKRLNEQLDSFAYTVSHDLKAPLKNIEGILNLMADSFPGNEEFDGFMGMLRESVDKMNRLISDVFIYSRFGIENLQKTRVDVRKVVKEIGRYANPGEKFEIDITLNLPVLWTEEVYIQQIFSNLIGNAIKYHDREQGKIRVRCEESKKFFIFSVVDDGPGISPREQDKIFRMFYTSRPGKEGSSGLGLPIVKKIVEMKGGKIWVESEGRGSRFTFTWPVSEALRGSMSARP